MTATALHATGSVNRANEIASRTNRTLGLFFHDPPGDLFARVVKWFQKREYRFVSADELEGCFKTRTPLPKRSACISFDDAWKRNLTEVISVVQAWDLPVTIFVPTGEVHRGTFWFSHALRNASALPDPFRKDVFRLWSVPESTRRRVIDQLFEVLPPTCREVMSAAEIAQLAKLPQITIGSHSVNHAIMPNCDDEELRREIYDSKRDLEEWTGRPVRVFSYPNGDFDQRTGSVLAEAGYSLAFTTESRAISVTDDPYYIPRLSIMDDGSLAENICHALGVWSPAVNSFKRLRPILIPQHPTARESELPL
jgi:peptidoglycan/xylan/chitin deacetylase (PgdA/CDA1 family)